MVDVFISQRWPAGASTPVEEGGHYFDERDRQGVERRLVSRLEGMGYKVTLQPAA